MSSVADCGFGSPGAEGGHEVRRKPSGLGEERASALAQLADHTLN